MSSPYKKIERYYLALRPISHDIRDTEEYLEPIARVTGLDHITLRQMVVGSSPQILKTSTGEEELQEMARELRRDGLKCAVLKKTDIKNIERPLRATSVDISSKSLRVLGRNEETLVTIDASSEILIVLACIDYERLNSKRLANKLFNKQGKISKEDTLQFIFQHKPVMDIYTAASATAVRIDSSRFNFTSLGELKRAAVSLNFEILIKEIGKASGSTLLETGFGEHIMPFMQQMRNLSPEVKTGNLKRYSSFINLLWKDGLYKSTERADASPLALLMDLPVFGELGGIFWGGPLNPAGVKRNAGAKRDDDDNETTAASSSLKLPPPPEGLKRATSKWVTTKFSGFLPMQKKLIRHLGPAVIFYPLTTILAISLFSAYLLDSIAALIVSLAPFGIILFAHSLVMVQRKRAIENCPTSKLRSMPMGEVETNGLTRAKHHLQAPYSMSECVHYSYKIYERVHTRDGITEKLTGWGESGPVPFYLEDEGVRVTVMPKDAVLKAGRSETFRGNAGILGLWASSPVDSGRRVVETIIPVGEKLYVLGYARRHARNSDKKRRKMTDKLRALKQDRHRMMKHYDKNNDGRIDSEEWDRARSDAERELLRESLSEESSDNIVIGEHPSGGLFYISDRKEEHILKRLAWMTPVSFILGLSSFACGFYYLLKIIGNNGNIYELLERVIKDFVV